MFKTRITELLGIEYPILAGPMAYLSGPELAAAVSDAGGLGIIASLTYQSTDELRKAIRGARNLTDRPFAVNVTLLPLARPVDYEGYFRTIMEEGINIIETSGRSPEPYMKLLKDSGAIVLHRATRTRDVRTAERVGVDAVTILGTEAGGHPGQEDVGSMVRIPAAMNAVSIPVIAGGGISDARGFVAALALGADGVLMGTRFMISRECALHSRVKDWLLSISEADTILIQKSIKNALRVVRTEHTEKILEMENRGATLEELMPMLSGKLSRNVYTTGEIESDASIPVGQTIGLINDIPTVKEIIDSIISEADDILKRLNNIAGEV